MEEQEKNIIKVEIFGTHYTLKTDAEEEYVQGIADNINQRLKALTEKHPELPAIKTATLCLIELMDDLLIFS